MENAPNLDPYAPCHCGSGKKYKFCCMKTDRKKESSAPPPPPGHVCQPGEHGHGDARSNRQSPGQTFRPPPGRTPGRNG